MTPLNRAMPRSHQLSPERFWRALTTFGTRVRFAVASAADPTTRDRASIPDLYLLPAAATTFAMSSRLSPPRFLAVLALAIAPALFAQTKLLEDKFNDGSRTDLNPISSAAWYSSSAGNTVFTNGTGGANGTLAVDNGSSRTLVGYFNAIGSPVTVTLGDTLTLDVIFTIDGVPAVKSNGLIFGLLQSVTNTNPAAVPGTGYTSGPRVNGDFGSSNPTSHVFGAYT